MVDTRMGKRTESDSLGDIEVDEDRYWGAQTERARRNFMIGDRRMPHQLIVALAMVKIAAARCNAKLGKLDGRLAAAIEQAAQQVADGDLKDEFPLSIYQSGSGTQSNMNVNEVIANRANELLGGKRGDKQPVHPNDHVNLSQSSNDVFPTAMAIAVLWGVDRLVATLEGLADAFSGKQQAFADVVKLGRTHLMDATPITLGDELGSYVAQLTAATQGIAAGAKPLWLLPIGGTAVGTGLNAPPQWAEAMCEQLRDVAFASVMPAPNKLAGQAAHDAMVSLHGAVKTAACALMKIANDLRWLASGPRGGLGELRLPANEPGSSIMPGKVNPTQCEALRMVCVRVLGNDTAISVAGASGDLELNVFKPLMASCCLESVMLLADAVGSFTSHTVVGLEVDRRMTAQHVERSLMLVTALTPHIGYDRAATLAHRAHQQDKTLREVALESGWLSEEEYDSIVNPAAMAGMTTATSGDSN